MWTEDVRDQGRPPATTDGDSAGNPWKTFRGLPGLTQAFIVAAIVLVVVLTATDST
jgi:hypothetical protein